MKYTVSASRSVLLETTSFSIIYLLQYYGFDYYRRRNMLVLNGANAVIGTPEEVDRLKLEHCEPIGTVNL